jgi:hypothetical protein
MLFRKDLTRFLDSHGIRKYANLHLIPKDDEFRLKYRSELSVHFELKGPKVLRKRTHKGTCNFIQHFLLEIMVK